MALKEYLTENKKLLFESAHITHLEDNVFDGEDGINRAIQFVGPIFDTLDGTGNNISMKWDGSPAVIFGTDPSNGKFFVSTKSIFNKVPLVAYSEKDIDKIFISEGLGVKLKEVFKYLKKTNPSGIYQGDILFTKNKKKETIDGKQYITFTPNTITYAIPIDSDLAKDVMRAKVGIVVHTRYKGEIGNLKQSFDVIESEFTKTPDVWLKDASIKDVSNINLDKSESEQIKAILGIINDKKGNIEKISSKVRELLKFYKNYRIKSNVGILPAEKGIEDFISFIEEKYKNDINNIKDEKGKTRLNNEKDRIIKYVNENSDNIIMTLKIYNWFVRIKMIVLRKLNQIESIGTFIKQGNGYKVTTPEGFVVIANNGGVTKLVDRLEFSRLNFTIPHNWR